MKDQLKALYELQDIDTEILRAKVKLAKLGAGKELKLRLQQTREAAERTEKVLSRYESEMKDNELKLGSLDDKRAKTEKRLYSGAISNAKEAEAAEKELETIKAQQSELDERTLELYDVVADAREKADHAKQELEAVKSEVDQQNEQTAAERESLDKEIESLLPKREAAAAKIKDKRLLSRYDAVRKSTGTTGMAKVTNGQCEGCRMAITPFMMRRLLAAQEYDYCENCGRILLLEIE